MIIIENKDGAQVIQNVTVTTSQKSYFRYRGICAEIGYPHRMYGWCYYLYLNLNQFVDQKFAAKLWVKAKTLRKGSATKYWDYFKAPLFFDIDLHGGCTYYEKLLSTGDARVIKIGCDYSHYRDLDGSYSLDDLVYDAKHSIDTLHMVCQYLIFCNGDGRLVPENEGEYTDNGDFYSFEWKKERAEEKS